MDKIRGTDASAPHTPARWTTLGAVAGALTLLVLGGCDQPPELEEPTASQSGAPGEASATEQTRQALETAYRYNVYFHVCNVSGGGTNDSVYASLNGTRTSREIHVTSRGALAQNEMRRFDLYKGEIEDVGQPRSVNIAVRRPFGFGAANPLCINYVVVEYRDPWGNWVQRSFNWAGHDPALQRWVSADRQASWSPIYEGVITLPL